MTTISKNDLTAKTWGQMRLSYLGGTRGPRTFMRKFIRTVPEFKEYPIFQILGGMLVYRCSSGNSLSTYRLSPHMLGLNVSRLMEGQRLKLDLESFGYKRKSR